MTNFKKSALASVFVLGLAASAVANAAATATVIWSGTVPVTNASDTLVITGLAGDLTALNGTITPTFDGVFESDAIILESHANTGDATTPVVGDLALANWTLLEASVAYDGVAIPGQVVEVDINGATVELQGQIPSTSTISTKIKQTAVLPEAEVGGKAVQATVTVMADVV